MSAVAPVADGRPTCARCRRPRVVCTCALIQPLSTRTRIVLLQHPRERRVGIGTARMAHLSLPGSLLRVGLDFAGDAVVRAALAGPDPAYVLFPGRGARDVTELPAGGPLTLVVLDGTWWQARKLLKLNPALAALPRVAFAPRRPSDYRIRRQPAEVCVSTIEALAEVLAVLEPAGTPVERLLEPFRAMVARQEWFADRVHESRHQRAVSLRGARRSPSLAERLAADWPRLVCVQGEANAWPLRAPDRPPPETVHWLACRPATGERYESVVAPRRPLAPTTPRHAALTAERLRAGASAASWHRSWRAFCRPDDVIVSWGSYYRDLAVGDGLWLPEARLDLRAEIAKMLGERVGTVEACAVRLGAAAGPEPADVTGSAPGGAPVPGAGVDDSPTMGRGPGSEAGAAPGAAGRAGERLASLLDIVRALRQG